MDQEDIKLYVEGQESMVLRSQKCEKQIVQMHVYCHNE